MKTKEKEQLPKEVLKCIIGAPHIYVGRGRGSGRIFPDGCIENEGIHFERK